MCPSGVVGLILSIIFINKSGDDVNGKLFKLADDDKLVDKLISKIAIQVCYKKI